MGMDARFSKPVMPGDTLTVRMWSDGNGGAIFQTVTQDGTVVIDNGKFTHAGGSTSPGVVSAGGSETRPSTCPSRACNTRLVGFHGT